MRARIMGVAATACLLGGGTAWAQHDDGGMGHGHHGSCDPETAVAQPILSVGDFDADGRVTGYDQAQVQLAVNAGEYIAIMDRDADGDLDADDVAIVRAEKQAKATSTAFDRELVGVYEATKRYQDINNAIADGYRPFTQELAGHGAHWARTPLQADPSSPTGLNQDYVNILDENVDMFQPEGLNYDQDGNLVAVFHYHGVNVLDWVMANWTNDDAAVGALVMRAMMLSTHMPLPDVFSDTDDSEMWHQHYGACFAGIDYLRMTFDITIVPTFYQPLTDMECFMQSAADQGLGMEDLAAGETPKLGWLPAFNMMHVWVHKVNRCGVFAGTDPDVSPNAPEEPHLFSFEEWYAKQFGGGGGDHH
jgi:hypothetical protein